MICGVLTGRARRPWRVCGGRAEGRPPRCRSGGLPTGRRSSWTSPGRDRTCWSAARPARARASCHTFVASLALGNTPEAMTFVLIDYKGGAAFQGCLDLPHVTGFLSDLDEHLGNRVLAALRAERRVPGAAASRREMQGHRDLPRSRRAPGAAAPAGGCLRRVRGAGGGTARSPQADDRRHRRGRSLGVHLVLATQRPAGAVKPTSGATPPCASACGSRTRPTPAP